MIEPYDVGSAAGPAPTDVLAVEEAQEAYWRIDMSNEYRLARYA